MKPYIEERAIEVANFIIHSSATVRETAKQFGISKSTVHTVVTKRNASLNIILLLKYPLKGSKYKGLKKHNHADPIKVVAVA